MVFLDEYSSIVLATAPGMKKRTLVPNTTYFELSVFDYGVSTDKKFVYLAHDYFKVRLLIVAQQKRRGNNFSSPCFCSSAKENQ